MNLKVKKICKDKGLTITQLAERLNIKQESLSRAINGNPTLETLEKIAAALNVPLSDLFDELKGNVFRCPACGTKLQIGEFESA